MQKALSALIIYLGTGNGFKAPAVSIGQELISKKVTVEYFDFFNGLDSFFLDKVTKSSWRFFLNIPFLFKLLLLASDNLFINKIIQQLTYHLGGLEKKIANQLQAKKPDFIIFTDFLSHHAYSFYIKKKKLPIKLFYYNSDVVFAHQSFINQQMDFSLVASSEGYAEMINRGLEKKKVILIPFPLDRKYQKKFKSQKQERKKLGLKNKFTLLFSAGGEGIGVFDFIEKMYENQMDIQSIVICGKSRTTFEKIKSLEKKYPAYDIIPQGFVDNMHEYLYCSDISVGKAGMNSIFESIYLKKPFISLLAMANEENVENYLLKKKLGWKIRKQDDFINLVKKVQRNHTWVEDYQKEIGKFQICFSSEKIASIIINKLKSTH